MMYSCEKRSISYLESSFVHNFTDFFLFRVEVLATDLVVAEEANEDWKANLLDSCKESVESRKTASGGDELDNMVYKCLSCKLSR